MKEEAMKKHIALALLGTALTSWPVLAQQSNAPAQQSTAPAQQQTSAKAANQDKAMVLKQGEWRGSKLTGLTVHNNNDERVGDINELIVGRDGKIESIVLGVGGFLGMGEHDVAVPFGQVKFVEEPRGSDRTAARTDARPADRPATTAENRPATADNRPAATATTSNAPRTSDRDTYRGYPDHAVINMSKDQLKALPEVRYSR
jgi:sporulation protein YlmC with PRC-barrel domain